jgi:hypothetical protein
MLRFVIAVGALASIAACTSSSIRAQEGHACSTDPSDDPQYVCTPAQDLVCIATYSRPVTNPEVAMKYDGGLRQVFVCRLACNTSAECPQSGDICCKGQVFGKTYNKQGGCVPPGSCDNAEEEPTPDGGTVPADAAPKEAGAADSGAAADAGAPDQGPAAMDAPAGA